MPSQSSSADNISGIRSGEHDASFLDMLPDDNKQPYSSPIKHRDSHGPNGWGVGKRFEEEMKPDMEELKKGAFGQFRWVSSPFADDAMLIDSYLNNHMILANPPPHPLGSGSQSPAPGVQGLSADGGGEGVCGEDEGV